MLRRATFRLGVKKKGKKDSLPTPLQRGCSKGNTILALFSSNDLRITDNYPLTLAAQLARKRRQQEEHRRQSKNSECLVSSLHCAFCFDVRSFAQPSRVAGFYRSSPLRTNFLLQCVEDLQLNLARFNVPLHISVGLPEVEIPKLCSLIGASVVFQTHQYAPQEYDAQLALRKNLRKIGIEEQLDHQQQGSPDDQQQKEEEEESVAETRTGGGGVELKTVWGTTLVHLDDLATQPKVMRPALRWFFDEFDVSPVRPTKPYDCSDGRLADVAPSPGELEAIYDRIEKENGQDDTKKNTESLLPNLIYNPARSKSFHRHNAGLLPLGVPTLSELGYGSLNRYMIAQIAGERALFGGESSALLSLDDWLDRGGMRSYVSFGRDFSHKSNLRDEKMPSRMSPYLATGALSPRIFYEKLREHSYERMGKGTTERQYREAFLRLGRRDFWHFLGVKWGRTLFYPYGPTPEDTEDVPDYRHDEKIVRKWCDGLNGIPFADAAMKELVTTGFVGHEARGALVWLLTQGYGQDWRIAAEWLERCSIDYDPHMCWGQCAYTAGLIQDRFGDVVRPIHYVAHKHDTMGLYIKKWLPALARVPDCYIHRVHVLTQRMQEMHNVHLGATYPYPVKLWDGVRHQQLRLPNYYSSSPSSLLTNGVGVGYGEALAYGTKLLELSSSNEPAATTDTQNEPRLCDSQFSSPPAALV